MPKIISSFTLEEYEENYYHGMRKILEEIDDFWFEEHNPVLDPGILYIENKILKIINQHVNKKNDILETKIYNLKYEQENNI